MGECATEDLNVPSSPPERRFDEMVYRVNDYRLFSG